MTARSRRDHRIVVVETIGCALATLRRLSRVCYDEDICVTITEVRSALGRSVEGQGEDRRSDRRKDTSRMKIYSMEVETDLGRRVVQLSAPLDVEPHGEMPQTFRSLTELLWDVLQQVAIKGADLAAAAPKAEA